jgi:hypothetical protein
VPAVIPDGRVTDICAESGVFVRAPTESQLPPEVVAGVALNDTADPSLVVTMTFCGVAVPPTVAVKLRPVELRLSAGGPAVGIGVVTVRVTGTESGLFEAPAAANETLPLYVPAARPVATMPTVAVTGVLPPGGTTVSQLAVGVVVALVVTAIGEPPLVTETVCVGGSAPLTVKVNDVGIAVNVGVGGGGGVVTAGVIVNVFE